MFRAWNRLCLHAASRNAAESQSAKDTPVAKGVESKVEENEASAATTAVSVLPSTATLQERAEAAVQGAREQRQKRAVQLVSSSPDSLRRGHFQLLAKRAGRVRYCTSIVFASCRLFCALVPVERKRTRRPQTLDVFAEHPRYCLGTASFCCIP